MDAEEIAQCRRTFGEVIDAHNVAGNHRMHFTGFWHPTLAGQYFWHCLDCQWYFCEWEDGRLAAHNPVLKAELNLVCGSCARGFDIHPKYPDSFSAGRVGTGMARGDWAKNGFYGTTKLVPEDLKPDSLFAGIITGGIVGVIQESIDIEGIKARNKAAEKVCAEDGCGDPIHLGPRRDIAALLAEVERLRSEYRGLYHSEMCGRACRCDEVMAKL